jgi:thiol-disulfide isomerase/thioredoxin|tara:strand:+ start:8956 stop:9540 length:585 start_codon:yes stop_codon:yes gene_type:complete
LALAAAVAVAFLVAITTGGEPEARDSAQVGSVEITGSALPPLPRSGTDPAVGIVSPSVRATTFDETSVTLEADGKKSLVIGFFTHWCSHCRAELPTLTAWLDANDPPEGVEVVAVSTSVDSGAPNHPPSAWFEEVGWPEVVLRDSSTNEIATSFGLTSFPYFVVVGPDGRVRLRASGELDTQQWEILLEEAAAR